MPRRRVNKKKFDECGHVGFGKICRRCEQAEKLEKASTWPKRKYKTNKKRPDKEEHIVWTKEELLEEAKRLREEGRKF